MRIRSLVDMHVHLREPGFGYKESIRTGTMAAKAGGFSLVCSMPNLDPVPDTVEHLDRQLEIIERDAAVRVIPFASITRGRRGDFLVDYEALAPMVAGFSDDGTGVQSGEVMREAMKGIARTGKILSAHCEIEALLPGPESEWREIERDIRLAAETGCRLHICHVSTREGVELIREAKREGLAVTAETCPHYLAFCDEDVEDDGSFKMNPPIRTRKDMEALREALADGTIDVVVTDHAPHSAAEKSRGFAKSAMGVVGLEIAFPAVYTTMVRSGLMPMERLIDAMAVRPRQILGLPLEDNDYIEVDLDESFVVDPEKFLSMGRSTPFAGKTLYGVIKR